RGAAPIHGITLNKHRRANVMAGAYILQKILKHITPVWCVPNVMMRVYYGQILIDGLFAKLVQPLMAHANIFWLVTGHLHRPRSRRSCGSAARSRLLLWGLLAPQLRTPCTVYRADIYDSVTALRPMIILCISDGPS